VASVGQQVVADAVDWLKRGREAWSKRAWAEARAALERADQREPLASPDLELLATSLFMCGRFLESRSVLERAYQLHLGRGEPLRAARPPSPRLYARRVVRPAELA
jgi:hypothetical protein